MKKVAIFFTLLLMVPSAVAEWFYNSETLVTDIELNSGADIVPLTPSGYVDTATINLTFFPKQYNDQDIISLYTSPEAEPGKNLKFTWKRPEDAMNFVVDAIVKTHNAITKVNSKIRFPIENLPADIIPYTRSSKTIDSEDEDIIKLASEIVEGEDDLYSAVFKVADWTKNNIEYNLSTLTAEVSQKASWVLENRQGVCDELTSLFIALLRSIGVPAKFISGVAYTNSPLFPDNWGAHGWAEVYFPGYGWMPFDVTYGQFGWVDPTHIKFRETIDSDEPSTYYQWVGRNADLKTKELDLKVSIIEKTGYSIVPLKLEAFPLKKAVSFGSYNMIEASIENLNDYYYATEIYMSKPKEISIVGNDIKNVLLLPGETKKVYWIVKVGDSLSSRYSYTFPIIVSTLNNISIQASFTSSSRDDDVEFAYVEKIAKLLDEEKQKAYSGNVLLNCAPKKSWFYYYENATLGCQIRNTGNVFLENLDVCFEGKCSNIDLGISQSRNLTFGIDNSVGLRESQVTLKNEIVSKSFPIELEIYDDPKVLIEDLEFPLNVSRDKNFTVYFTLDKKSASSPANVVVTFSGKQGSKTWSINELAENEKFALNFEGGQLRYGLNEFAINADYKDLNGKQYSVSKKITIRQMDANMLQKAYYSLGFGNLSDEMAIVMLSLIGVAFILIVMWVFRRKSKVI